MVIPKIIHYCWFGGKPLPEEAKKCIDSWKKYLPDYEIKEWNESNFDINSIAYTAEAYEARKYAFVSDYARYKILYEHGGIYFDTDVEVIAPMDDLLAKGPFMGQEDYLSAISLQNEKTISVRGINPGRGMAATPGMQFFGQMLELYSTLHFIGRNGRYNLKTIVQYTTEHLYAHGAKETDDIQHISGIYIYPPKYFAPKSYITGETNLTDCSRSIHHYKASWVYQQNPVYIHYSKKYHWVPKVIRRHFILTEMNEIKAPFTSWLIKIWKKLF